MPDRNPFRPKPEFSLRGRELSLLLRVLLVAVAGLALVFFGQMATSPPTAQAVDINTASGYRLAHALGVPESVGDAIVAERRHQHGGRFGTVYALRHARALDGVETNPIDSRYIVRTESGAAFDFWRGVAAFVLGFLVVHAVLRKAAPRGDPFLVPLVALLAAIGLMMLFAVKDPLRETFAYSRQVAGIVGFGLVSLILPQLKTIKALPLRRYRYMYAIAAIGLLALLILFGHGPGGIHIQVLGFEPVEFIKLLLVFFVASYLADRRGTIADSTRGTIRARELLPLAVIYGLCLALFVVMKDLGPAVLLFGTLAAMLYLETRKAAFPIAAGILLLVAGSVAYVVHMGFFSTRVTMWLHPWNNGDRNGAQLAQALWGMSTGGTFGSGLGLGEPGMMSRAGSDLVFASIGEELGLVGSLCVLTVYCVIITRGFRIANDARTDFDRMLAAGITTLFGLQTMIIVGGVTGLVPLTGVTLPFVSFGASSLVANFLAIGMLLQISNRQIPEGIADPVPDSFRAAARTTTLVFGAYLLVAVGLIRLAPIQLLWSSQTATRRLVVPDRDGVARAHTNPRLLAFALTIPRGRILDRNGRVLAEDAPLDRRDTGVAYFTPDGRRRLYAGGASFAHLMYAVEAARTPTNRVGMNEILQGYRSPASLLGAYRRRYAPGFRPQHGRDVSLTIDSRLQDASYDALGRKLATLRDGRTGLPKERGAAVVVDTATGEVLAAVSRPSFDPMRVDASEWGALVTDADHREALLDRSLKGVYPPGSSFKIVTGAAGLESGLGAYTHDCAHVEHDVRWTWKGARYSRSTITDEEGFRPHGRTTMFEAIRVSCNLYFAHLGLTLGPAAIAHEGRAGFQLGYLPDVDTMAKDLPDCAYGQGTVVVTPVEMARAAQAVANGGTMLPLRFFRDIDAPSIGTTTQPLSPANAAEMKSMLASAAYSGTAAGVFEGLPVAVAGKTGSAQNGAGDRQTHSWFVGFAPAPNPTIAFACVVENGGAGRAAAAPVCREIVRAAL